MSIPKIHQFDPVIYPVKLWVTITDKLENLQDRFKDDNGEELKGNISRFHAATCDVISKETNCWGVCVVFTERKSMAVGIMAHEAYHAVKSFFDRIEEKYPSEEATSYLLEWVVDCMNQVRTNKFK